MRLLVTVGSHSFDELIEHVDKKEFHRFLWKSGFSQMTVQIGNGSYVPKLTYDKREGEKNEFLLEGINIFRFKSSLDEDFEKADIVVTHAGAGTTFQCLRRKKKIVTVVNANLMNNHQMEFAQFMYLSNYLEICKCVSNLEKHICECLKRERYETLPEPTTDHFLRDLDSLIDSGVIRHHREFNHITYLPNCSG
ncbi:glycosyltransferase family 28 protein, putative [Plasmodium ovale wallikeri]|nr:glycosyltransferase family 28 protein, putative [Plasmodium ovale wallikeri]